MDPIQELWWLLDPVWELLPAAVAVTIIGCAVLVIVRAGRGSPWRKAVASATLDVGVAVAIASVLVLAFVRAGNEGRSLVLVPFAELRGSSAHNAVSQHIANVAMFVPLGALIPLRWRWFDTFGHVILASALFALGIEVLQWVVATGRQASITDVIMNTAGGALGYSVSRIVRSTTKNRAPRDATA